MEVTPRVVVDLFISDCLLPTKGRGQVLSAKELYGYYQAYCDFANQKVTSKIHFGRCLASRFKPSRRQGRNYFYCELNRNVIDWGATDDQQENV